jgi:hypothetical protein
MNECAVEGERKEVDQTTLGFFAFSCFSSLKPSRGRVEKKESKLLLISALW